MIYIKTFGKKAMEAKWIVAALLFLLVLIFIILFLRGQQSGMFELASRAGEQTIPIG
jgi:hypothetical protein